MTSVNRWSPEADPLALCTGFVVLSAVLAVLDPYFLGLTIALGALGASVWLGGSLRSVGGTVVVIGRRSVLVGTAALAGGWIPALALPGALGRWTVLPVALAAVALWAERAGRGRSVA